MVLVVGVALGLAADIVLEVLVVVADDVARGIVLADDVVAVGALGPTTADALGALPHKLGEVTRVAVEAGLVKVVLGALVAPEVGPAVRGRPAAAPGDVFTVRVVGLLHKHCQQRILKAGVSSCGAGIITWWRGFSEHLAAQACALLARLLSHCRGAAECCPRYQLCAASICFLKSSCSRASISRASTETGEAEATAASARTAALEKTSAIILRVMCKLTGGSRACLML